MPKLIALILLALFLVASVALLTMAERTPGEFAWPATVFGAGAGFALASAWEQWTRLRKSKGP
ncbi:hypothetical protein D3C85_638360 [compost metagenome]